MDKRKCFLAFILLDALEDCNEKDIFAILERSEGDVASVVVPERGIAPLHYACGMDSSDMAIMVTRLFLEKGADPNVETVERMTPLHVAAMCGRVKIVELLLQHGARFDVYDEEERTPMHYAIEEGYFEVVELMREYILAQKYGNKLKSNAWRNPLNKTTSKSSPQFGATSAAVTPVNRTLRAVTQSSLMSTENHTPQRIEYNYDVTSPYYINITHRRHRPQPVFPAVHKTAINDTTELPNASLNEAKAVIPNNIIKINLFDLSEENVKEFTQHMNTAEHSRASLIDTWRKKVQDLRNIIRNSLITQECKGNIFKDEELHTERSISMQQHDFSNTTVFGETVIPALIDESTKSALDETGDRVKLTENASIHDESTVYASLPTLSPAHTTDKTKSNDTTGFIHSPSNDCYFMSLAEAYVHTDDENGMVFYETKLLSNPGNKVAFHRQQNTRVLQPKPTNEPRELNASVTSQSTNFTLPSDYETDALRAELTNFGLPPGPITNNTKRLYIKKLIKCKRQNNYAEEMNKNLKNGNTLKFSVELQRTVRSAESFDRIPEYMRYDAESTQYFANHQNRRKLREGHLKQSFIYMLIDPRVSCNLPGESVFLDKFSVWRRFLQSVFYVGKGKTSRPYSHLYDAMKLHTRMRHIQAKAVSINGKQVSIKKQTLDLAAFKTPPKRTTESKKLDRILEIWSHSRGVVCLHVFHNIMPTDAYTREAAIIDALGLQHLTNLKRGDYYGPAQRWNMREKKYLGIALLFKAMQIFLAEGESQISPGDLI